MNVAIALFSMCSIKMSEAKLDVEAPMARPWRWMYNRLLNTKYVFWTQISKSLVILSAEMLVTSCREESLANLWWTKLIVSN